MFDDNRYFDVFVEYAKAAPDDVLVRISVCNRGPDAAPLHVLPTLWFRNTWSQPGGGSKPILEASSSPATQRSTPATADPLFQESLADYYLYCDADVPLLFTENETNNARLFGSANASPYVKDGIDNFVVHGDAAAVNPAQRGNEGGGPLPGRPSAPGKTQVIRLRLTTRAPEASGQPFGDFDAVFAARLSEADAFYALDHAARRSRRPGPCERHAPGAGGHAVDQAVLLLRPRPLARRARRRAAICRSTSAGSVRNSEWSHMFNDDIISMPDKWEYPWYAAWDLAFHMIPLGMVDPDFAKQQLDLMLRNDYLHPNGQLPAYEWNFGDVNPPVHAWATMQLYLFDKERRGGSGDIEFLKYAFSKLLVNFTWWVNRKDRTGANVFEGGFLGLDNIGVFDRSSPLPTGGYLDQADGTAWMVFFSQQMLRIAVELALHEPLYEEFVEKFFQHTLFIAGAMDRVGERHDEMWDEEDGFFYDVLRFPDGSRDAPQGALDRRAAAAGRGGGLRRGHPREAAEVPRACAAVHRPPPRARRQHASAPGSRAWPTAGCCRSWTRRSCGASSRACWTRPSSSARTAFARCRASTSSTPTSSTTPGRSIAWPTCRAIPTPACSAATPTGAGRCGCRSTSCCTRALLRLYAYYGDDFKVECPTGSGQMMTLLEVAKELGERLSRIFLRDAVRPPAGRTARRTSSTTIRTGGTWCSSTSTSMATPAPASAPATRPAGPAASPGSSRPTPC